MAIGEEYLIIYCWGEGGWLQNHRKCQLKVWVSLTCKQYWIFFLFFSYLCAWQLSASGLSAQSIDGINPALVDPLTNLLQWSLDSYSINEVRRSTCIPCRTFIVVFYRWVYSGVLPLSAYRKAQSSTTGLELLYFMHILFSVSEIAKDIQYNNLNTKLTIKRVQKCCDKQLHTCPPTRRQKNHNFYGHFLV